MIGQPAAQGRIVFPSLPALGLLLTVTLPSALFVSASASSMSLPLTAAALVWYAIAGGSLRAFHRSDSSVIVTCFSLAIFFIAHASLSNRITGTVDFERLSLSLLMFAVDTIAASLAARCLISVKPRTLIQAANVGLTFLSVIGIASLLGVPAIGHNTTGKPVVIFSEPSHYGLAYLPILLFRVSTCSRSKQILLLAFSVVLAAALQSLTIIAGVFIIACVLLRSTPLILLLVCAGAGALAVDLTYYVSRLTLTSDSENLSTLVFLQGWDNAQLNFRETLGLGVGFQQFGIAGSTGDISDRIAELSGESLNLYDGGSTATKLVGEFGVLGILTTAALAIKMAVAALYIRRVQRIAPADRNVTTLLFSSVIMSFAVELFMKGIGYFSPGAFLLVSGLFGLSMQRRLAVRRQPGRVLDYQP